MGSFERGIIQGLSRSDKWYLGGAGPLLWAPPFPVALSRPGFWDPAQFYRHAVGPLFAVDLLDLGGEPLELVLLKRRWNPAYSLAEYQTPHGVRVTERKVVLPAGVVVSEFRLEGDRRLDVTLAAWTVQPNEGVPLVREGAVALPRRLGAPVGDRASVWLALSAGPEAAQVSLVGAEAGVPLPNWRHCALWEARTVEGKAEGAGGFWHAGVLVPVSLTGGAPRLVQVAMAVGLDPDGALREASSRVRADSHVVEESMSAWEDYFAKVPRFDCSDEYVTTYYWYRWAGLRLCTQAPGAGFLGRPVVCEGPGYFRRAITYSAPAHVRETRWMREPDLAISELLTFFDAQEGSGRFPGILDVEGPAVESFYHADWGGAVLDLLAIHPDHGLTVRAYEALARYAEWLIRDRDPEGSGLFTIENHYETGQEYSSRYLAVDPAADREHWGRQFALKGVDATVYAYRLFQALACMAAQRGRSEDVARWNHLAARTREAVRARMWEGVAALFSDVDPSNGVRTMVEALTCFYPYMTDLATEEHAPGISHVFDPTKFWTPHPFPSLARDDPHFSAEGLWKGRRMNCPWNGRTWPMTNSHIVDAVVSQAWRSPALLPQAAEAFMRTLRVFFPSGDAKRPTSFEHYNPLTGRASTYRGVDDYQHSWVVDLIVRHVAGLQPTLDGALVVAPLPLDFEFVRLQGAMIRGHTVDVELARGRVTELRIDGRPVEVTSVPCTVDLEGPRT